MGRTNVVLDDELVREGLRLCDARSIRELVDRSLREFVERRRRLALLELRGCGRWEGELDAMRRDRAADDR